MSDHEVVALLEPLVRHQAFPSVEAAMRALVRDYVLRQIEQYRERLVLLEKQHGMTFEQFSAYLKERAALVAHGQLDAEQKQRVAQAVMAEEEDWLDWKIAREFLEGWVGVTAEVAV